MNERIKDRTATIMLLITMLLSVVATVTAQSTVEYSYFNDMVTAANLRQKNDARISTPYQYDLNMLVKLNHTLSLQTLNRSNPIYWILTRYTNETFQMQQNNQQVNEKLTKLPIFNLADPGVRTESIRNTFTCLPTETTCNTMTVYKFNISLIGMYSYQSLINSFESLYVYFNISTFVVPVFVDCNYNQSTSCLHNETSRALSVLQGTSVTFTCSVYIAQNDIYEPAVEMVISPENDPSECSNSPTVAEIVPPAQPYRMVKFGNVNTNMIMYQVSRNCTRTFTKTQSNVNYQCKLMPKVNPHVPIEIQPNPKVPYDVLNFRLDVQYPPVFTPPPLHQVNRTIIANTSAVISFICPYDSSPAPQFEWRVASANNTSSDGGVSPKKRRLDVTQFLTSTKEYVVPRDLDIGSYIFECRARTLGLIDKYSDVTQFNLNVIASPVTAKKAILLADRENGFLQNSKTNLGAIIGGTIGGVIAILLIVFVVIFLVRRHKNGSKDEIEKAKELDIDINDNNPHLSSRSNLSTAGLTTQSSNSNTVNSLIGNSNNSNQPQSKSNGIGHKVIAGLMVPSSTAQSYAAIAHAAAAAAQSNQQRNNSHQFVHPDQAGNFGNQNSMLFASNGPSTNSNNNINTNNNNPNKQQSYNNPSFFESTSYPIQNPLESPPPYDAALHQPIKKDSPLQQQRILMQQQQQQKDFMGSNTRLLSGSNTPTLQPKQHTAVPTSHSYTAAAPLSNLLAPPPNGSNSMQQIQYQQQMTAAGSLQYTTVQNLARNRNPLNGLPQHQSDIDINTNALNPIDV